MKDWLIEFCFWLMGIGAFLTSVAIVMFVFVKN